jgi:hypothetical protein
MENDWTIFTKCDILRILMKAMSTLWCWSKSHTTDTLHQHLRTFLAPTSTVTHSEYIWKEICTQKHDILISIQFVWAGIAQSVQRLAKGWTVRGSNPSGSEIFRKCPDRPLGHPNSYTTGTWSFPWVKRPGRGFDHPPTSRAEVKEREEICIYSPFGYSWPVLGWTSALTLLLQCVSFGGFWREVS